MSNGLGGFNTTVPNRIMGPNWGLSSHPTLQMSKHVINENTSHTLWMYFPEGVAFNFRYNTDLKIYELNTLFNPRDSRGGISPGSEGVYIDFKDGKLEVRRRDGRVYTYSPEPVYPNLGARTLLNTTSDDRPVARLESVQYEGGYIQTVSYNALDEISEISDNFGRQISFQRETREWITETGERLESRGGILRPAYRTPITQVDLPDGSKIEYTYDIVPGSTFTKFKAPDKLIRAKRTSQDGEVLFDESYLYGDERFPYALTGIVDSAGINYASWKYNAGALAIESTLADGLDKYTIDRFFGSGRLEVNFVVTNPLGRQTTYNADSIIDDEFGRFRSITGEPSPNCVGEFSSFSFNDNALEKTLTDSEGRRTRVKFDNMDRQIRLTRAMGTPEETVTTTTWHPQYWRKTQIVNPGLTTDYTYDDVGRMLTMEQTDTSPQAAGSVPRLWSFGYDGPNVTSIDGPLPGAADTQTFTYTGEKLTSVTNELGHQTLITAHNPNGAPARIEDPNGNITVLGYDAEHKLTNITESAGNLNAETTLTYNAVDLLTSVTQPNGSALFFEYDDARRLMAIRNSVNERIDYTRNAMGGIIKTEISGAAQGLSFEISQVTDELNRVIKTATVGGAAGFTSETTLGYDREDNLTSIIDPRQNNWQQNYDGLNRLVKEIDPLGAETDYGLEANYDERNPLASVTDARNVTTNYVRNGFGEVIREVSLEAGTTHYTRDTRGLVTQMTDGRGIITNYTYDAAGRLLSETYPSESTSDITYTYDEGPNGIGELTTVGESFGTTNYAYNSLGHMTGMTRNINGQSYTTSYTYDLAGEVITETYPSGRTIRMSRDAAARIIGIEAQNPNGTSGETEFTPLLSNITYAAFGPMTGADFADGHSLTINYDTAYRAKSLRRTSVNGSLMDISFDHDASGNILAMNDNVRPERSQSFTYDPVSRLTSANGGYGSLGYDYNLVGDRTARNYTPIDGSLQAQIYNYDASTARLTDITQAGLNLRVFGYDDGGNMITDTRTDDVITSRFEYGMNARGRLSTVSEEGALKASYTYDMSEQRIIKSVTGEAAIHYHYDGEGRLISETDAATGETIRDYVWLGLTPIASFAANDNAPAPDLASDPEPTPSSDCDEEGIAAQQALLEQNQAALVLWQDYLTVLGDVRDIRLEQIAQVETALETATGFRRFWLIWLERILENLVAQIEAAIAFSQDTITQIESVIATQEADIAAQQAICDAPVDDGEDEGPDDGASSFSVTFLHSDHLGRPQFGTNGDGEIVWDGGITTPFGVSMASLGAQTQALMFPGQYEDAETTGAGVTLSHNWHRTYDPTIGRYLQSDPIGLAGGLNRYAYVGGNPVMLVDPTGRIFFVPVLIGIAAGAAIDVAFQLTQNGRDFKCLDYKSVALSGALGAFGAGGGFARSGIKRAGQEWSHFIARKNVNQLTAKGSRLNRGLNRRGGLNGQWVSPQRHSKHDYHRRLKGEKVADKPSLLWRGFDRIPDYLKGGVGAPALGQLIPSQEKNCACQQ